MSARKQHSSRRKGHGAKRASRAHPHAASPRIQYTIRNVSRSVDTALRRKAAEAGISLNEVLLQALEKEVGLTGGETRTYHDLDHLAGTWVEDPEFDAAIAAQDVIDESLWK